MIEKLVAGDVEPFAFGVGADADRQDHGQGIADDQGDCCHAAALKLATLSLQGRGTAHEVSRERGVCESLL